METIQNILSEQNAFFKTQQTKNVAYRLQLLKALRTEIRANEEAFLDALHLDFKKSAFESYLSEFALIISELNLAIKKLKQWSKPKRVRSSILLFPSTDYIYNEPYGIVLIIAPWNYPFLLALDPLIMAVAAGNTVVLKPSELTPNTSTLITKIIANVFPKTVAISLEGGVDLASQLLKQRWDYIFFTGSTRVGKIVYEAAAKNLTPVTLELGGKSPCIIDNTVDLKLVARRLVWGKFLNAGQTCIAPDYVLAKNSIKSELIEALKKEITKSYGANPKQSEDFPRIINTQNFKRLKALLDYDHVALGGETEETHNYIAPTIMDDPGISSPVMNEEIFGPILPILSFETRDDITSIINSIEKPLSFYIFSKNKSFIQNLIAAHSFGGGVINDTLIHFGNNRLPFGGVGTSGLGKYHGKYGFETFSNQKPIVKRGTWFDPRLRYAPYKNKIALIRKIFKYLGVF